MLIDSEKLDVLKKAEANDPRALYCMSVWYGTGTYVPEDREKCKHYNNRLLELGPEIVNGLNVMMDYVKMLSLVGHMHFNDGEIKMAKKHFQNAINYVKETYPSCKAKSLIDHYRFQNRVDRINRVLGIKEN